MQTITISDETWEKIKGQNDFTGMELLSNDNKIKKWLHCNVPDSRLVDREIRRIGDYTVLLLLLPSANKEWTFAAWQYAMDFCNVSRSYPIHCDNPAYENSKFIYIRVYPNPIKDEITGGGEKWNGKN